MGQVESRAVGALVMDNLLRLVFHEARAGLVVAAAKPAHCLIVAVGLVMAKPQTLVTPERLRCV